MDPPKKQPSSPESAWQDEGLEFAITDFGDARRVLDDESISQFTVAVNDSPAHWKRIRRPTLPTDRALSGQAIDWLISLPPELRPQHLSAQFPRIANALAEAWHEPHECQAALDRFLCCERKGRKGFPAKVQDELIALRNWAQVVLARCCAGHGRLAQRRKKGPTHGHAPRLHAHRRRPRCEARHLQRALAAARRGPVQRPDLMVAKLKGEFTWHKHDDTDDFFLVLTGSVTIRLRDGDVTLGRGQLYVVPRGVEHCPVAEEGAEVLLIERMGTPNTGDVGTAAVRREI
jgi:mannose-6-phosphate isomerase-like protein (cupin superfamily)